MEHIYRQNIRGGVISFYAIFPKCSWFYVIRYYLNKMRGGVCGQFVGICNFEGNFGIFGFLGALLARIHNQYKNMYEWVSD